MQLRCNFSFAVNVRRILEILFLFHYHLFTAAFSAEKVSVMCYIITVSYLKSTVISKWLLVFYNKSIYIHFLHSINRF